MIRNKFICFVCGWSIHPKKRTETLHHVLRAMMQFPVNFFSGWILRSKTKKINKFLNFILALTTGNPVYLISTKGARWVWPVSKGCLLIRNTWSYLPHLWEVSVAPTLDFVIAFGIMITFYTLLTSLFCNMIFCFQQITKDWFQMTTANLFSCSISVSKLPNCLIYKMLKM
jgi:hypothetical protein